VRRAFEEMRAELEQHMMKEEHVLFPWVAQLARTGATGGAMPASPFGTVQNPIRMMEREHAGAAGELRLIRELTGGFQAPADRCATYAVCMAELARFECDLHRHVHLENNILFPSAIDLEGRLCAQCKSGDDESARVDKRHDVAAAKPKAVEIKLARAGTGYHKACGAEWVKLFADRENRVSTWSSPCPTLAVTRVFRESLPIVLLFFVKGRPTFRRNCRAVAAARWNAFALSWGDGNPAGAL
jgi:hemerythrin-like domain-containing protein